MAKKPLSYSLVTPARNERPNLRRLAACVVAQTVRPTAWIIVDDDSADGTSAEARDLLDHHVWIRVVQSPLAGGSGAALERGRHTGRDVVAFRHGVAEIGLLPDVVVKLDADVSFAPDYFERLLDAFANDPSLGIASGSCYEQIAARWEQTHVTGEHVRGATRAYRRECLQAVLPLDEHIGWDGIDEIKAHLAGWQTATLTDIPFHHHRKVGERDGARRRGWAVQGRAAHYMGYRFSYLVARAVYQARREPSALAMLPAYLGASARRAPRCSDDAVRTHLRETQRFRSLPTRAREARGL
jgi:glycosyltransferase involved in cell wall biosynthesis